MFAVIFEVQPRPERWDDYLAIAKGLKPKLEASDGFIDNDRFRSGRTEGRLLSLSTWRDEKAVVRWRTQAAHHHAQERGRSEIFADYHLRVGEIVADTNPPPGFTLEQQRFDDTAVGAAKLVTITEPATAGGAAPEALPQRLGLRPDAEGLVDHELFESIYTPGKLLLLASWRDAEAAGRWTPLQAGGPGSVRHRAVRIIRDYGLSDRREAPQYYPDVAPARAER